MTDSDRMRKFRTIVLMFCMRAAYSHLIFMEYFPYFIIEETMAKIG